MEEGGVGGGGGERGAQNASIFERRKRNTNKNHILLGN